MHSQSQRTPGQRITMSVYLCKEHAQLTDFNRLSMSHPRRFLTYFSPPPLTHRNDKGDHKDKWRQDSISPHLNTHSPSANNPKGRPQASLDRTILSGPFTSPPRKGRSIMLPQNTNARHRLTPATGVQIDDPFPPPLRQPDHPPCPPGTADTLSRPTVADSWLCAPGSPPVCSCRRVNSMEFYNK